MESKRGIGTDIFANQVREFRKLGFKRLETEALIRSGWNGAITWAKLGYEVMPDSKETFTKTLQNSDIPRIRECKTMSELMSFEEGRKFWEKNAITLNMEFDLSDGSDSMNRLNDYLKSKGKPII